MEIIRKIFLENKAWALDKVSKDKDYFNKLARIQEPDFLWIGCSDSRVPANEITNTEPGEVFVHRNVANVVDIHDQSFMSALVFAVHHLKVKHIVVCGHYGCGGIKAALSDQSFGDLDPWLSKIKQVYTDNLEIMKTCSTEEERFKRLVELNIEAGVSKIRQIEVVKNNPEIVVHGWVYDLKDGILKRIAQ